MFQSIRSKLLVSGIVLTAIIAAAGGVAVWKSRQAARQTHVFVNDYLRTADLIEALRLEVLDLTTLVLDPPAAATRQGQLVDEQAELARFGAALLEAPLPPGRRVRLAGLLDELRTSLAPPILLHQAPRLAVRQANDALLPLQKAVKGLDDQDLSRALWNAAIACNEAVTARDRQARASYRENVETLRRAPDFETYAAPFRIFDAAALNVFAAVDRLRQHQEHFLATSQTLAAELAELHASYTAEVIRPGEARVEQLLGEIDGVILATLGVMAAALLLLGAFATRHISLPLRGAVAMVEALAAGDFSLRLPVRRRDEAGRMAQALNRLAEVLQVAMLALAQGIERRKRAESDLQEALAQKEAILEAFEGAIYVCSSDHRIEFMNRKLADRIGYDATGELCHQALHGLPQPCPWCVMPMVGDDETVQYELQNPADGRWYFVVNSPLRHADGRVSLQAMTIDITRRKTAEEALRASQARYRGLFDNAPLPMWVVDLDTLGYLDVNQTAVDMYGYSREEFLAMTILDIRPPEEVARLHENLPRAREGMEEAGLWRHRRKDGAVLEVEIVLKDIPYDGRAARLVMATDVTEKESLRREADQVSRLAALGELAAGVAHEINNPNGLILMNLNLLADFYRDAEPLLAGVREREGELQLAGLDFDLLREELPAALAEMRRGARKIRTIVEDLKHFARGPRGEAFEEVDLGEVVEAALRLTANAIKQAGAVLSVDLAADPPPVRGRFQQLEQVVINLVLNACEALPEPGREIAVALRPLPADRAVAVTVHDQGEGIAPEVLAQIFDPFFTTKRESGGTGLGLSVSERIVREHGGRLEFASPPGRGTTVTLTLPAAAGDDKEA